MIKRVFTLLFFFSIIALVTAQTTSNLRNITLSLTSMSIKLDSNSIIPNSLSITELDSSQYAIDYISATLFLHDSILLGKEIHFSYRIFQYNFSKTYFHKSPTLITPKIQHYTPYIIDDKSEIVSQLFADPSLQSNGSISRKFSIGNSQDFSLNSSLNLQLIGNLTDDLEIVANITDKNVPIQPDGNSRMIQDFNKIFIELNYKNNIFLTAGDIEIKRPESYFLKVNRFVLGLKVASTAQIDSFNLVKNGLGGGISKGKYIRNDIVPIEGVQGPYQLYNDQHETNIMIVAGSERVYIDGKLMIRGEDNDYTIDYNVGEITFSSKQLITREKRIIIVFEYSNFAYTRYSLFSYNHFTHEKLQKLKLNVNFYQEHDLKNRSIQPELQNEHKIFLSQIGDQTSDAFYPMVENVAFNTTEILYKQTDTIVNENSYFKIYQHTNNPNDSCFRVKFNFIGENRGNYIQIVNSANGRIFAWIAPENGVPQGNYEPVMLLATPQLLQMGTIGAQYQFSKNSELTTEIAFTNFDKNRFSNKDDENNFGIASKISYNFQKQFYSKKNRSWDLNSFFSYEIMSKNFRLIESIREVEFGRIFNIKDDYSYQQDDHLLRLTTELKQKEIGSFKYVINYFSRAPIINALRNEVLITTKLKKIHFSTTTSHLYSKNDEIFSSFVNSDNLLSKKIGSIEIGIKDNLEYNIFQQKKSQFLQPNSYAFNDVQLFLKSQDSSDYLYQISLKNRVEYSLNEENRLSLHALIYEAQSSFEIAKIKNQRIRGIATYRNSSLMDTLRKLHPEHYGVGRIDYSGKFLKNFFLLSTYYELGSGMEQKRNYTFVKVFDGQGTHIWNDYNQNGIEELDEFEIATFRDAANYIKVWLASNEYINTFNNQFSQTLQIRPITLWYQKSGILKFLSQFSNATAWRMAQKTIQNNSINAINPFYFNNNDTNVTNRQLHFKNTFSFNQHASKFGADFIMQKNRNKNLLYYGFEENNIDNEELMININPHKMVRLNIHYNHAIKKNNSQYFTTRNYQIISHFIENSIKLMFNNRFDINFIYFFQFKDNVSQIEKLKRHQLAVEALYKIPEKGNLSAKIQYSQINYNQNSTNSISYEMLEGFQTGNNFVWGLHLQLYISKYMELNLEYEGRSFERKKVIHTGNLQVRAYF